MRFLHRTSLHLAMIASALLFYVCLVSSANAQTLSLTGAVTVGTNSAGAYVFPYDWDTLPGGAFNLFMIPGTDLDGAFLNGPADNQVAINIPLMPGTYTYTTYGQPNYPDIGYYGVNLSLNGTVGAANLSVFAPVQTSAGIVPALSITPATSITKVYGGAFVDAPGTQSFSDGNMTVALTDFRYAKASLFNKDRVGPYVVGANGSPDNIGQFTLDVTPAQYNFTRIADTSGPFKDFGLQFTDTGFVTLNNAGTILFYADEKNGGRGIYTGNGGAVTAVVHNNAQFAGFGSSPSIDDYGRVAFAASLYQGSGGLYTLLNGVLTQIASFNNFSNESSPSVNVGGYATFLGILSPGQAATEGIFLGNGGPLITVADNSGIFSAFNSKAPINTSGDLVFNASLKAGGSGIYLSHLGGPVTPIVQTGSQFNYLGSPSNSNSGLVAFLAGRATGGSGIYLTQGSSTALIASTDGAFSSFDYESACVNQSGSVVFQGTLKTGVNGIFNGPDPVANKIVTVGDPLDGSTVSELLFFNLNHSLNDHGQIAFTAKLADGRIGVYRATPLTTPGSGTGNLDISVAAPATYEADTADGQTTGWRLVQHLRFHNSGGGPFYYGELTLGKFGTGAYSYAVYAQTPGNPQPVSKLYPQPIITGNTLDELPAGASVTVDVAFRYPGIPFPFKSGQTLPLSVGGYFYTEAPDPVVGFLNRQSQAFQRSFRNTTAPTY